MLARPGAVIFDLDGTLLDTEPLYTQATQRIVGPFGKTFDLALKRRIMGGDARVGAATVIEALSLPIDIDEYLARRESLLRESFAVAPEIPGAGDFLNFLAEKGIPLGLATSSNQALSKLKLSGHAWRSVVGHKVYGDDPRLQNSKPAPDIFQICAETMAVEPDLCIAFEDSRNGVTAALAADMQVVAIDSPYVEPGDLATATLVIKSYAEVQKLFEDW